MEKVMTKRKEITVLKVGSKTCISNLVKAIIGNLKNDGVVYLDNMGPNATFLCNKALIYSANLLSNENIKVAFTPSLVDVEVDNPNDCVRIKTALRWTVRMS